MEKRYVVKDFETQTYYCGKYLGEIWSENSHLVEYFKTFEDAEEFIKLEKCGKFQIEVVYFV
jgi:hypothetical protein